MELGSDHSLLPLVHSIIQYCLEHNAETEACDLLMEIDYIEHIEEYVTEEVHERVCLYLSRYTSYPLSIYMYHLYIHLYISIHTCTCTCIIYKHASIHIHVSMHTYI